MTARPRLSVVVASDGRPGALRRCLLALAQSGGEAIEVIAVADKAGLEAVAGLPFGARVKSVLQAVPNLSAARNSGILRASGDLVAFLDDDAVVEPTWAAAVCDAFETEPDLAAATGPVLGRDGIRLQAGPLGIDEQGREAPLPQGVPASAPPVLTLHGTNMVVRRDPLLSVGGFDPAFRFHLEAADLSLRLAASGRRLGWIPGDLVHHAAAASARRRHDGVPLGLHDVGASTAAFLRKHAPGAMADALLRLAEDQRSRLFRLARKRKLGPGDIERLMADLRAGVEAGRHRQIGTPPLENHDAQFLPLQDRAVEGDFVLADWWFRGRALREKAARLTRGGARVTLVLLDPTARAHQAVFTDGGWWEQHGGLFGRSAPDGPRLQPWRLSSRIEAEVARLTPARFTEIPSRRFIGG